MEQTANEPSCALPAPSSSPSASCSAFLLPEEGCESPLDFQPSPLMEERRASFLHSHPSPSSSVPHKGFEEESLVDVRNGKPCIDLNDFLPSAEAYTAPPSQTCDEAQHQMSTPSYESQAASPAQHYMLSQTAPLDEQPNTPSPSYTSFSDAVVEQQQQLQPPPALLSDVGGYSQSQLPVSFALPSSPFLSSTTVQHHHPQPSPALTLPLRHHSRVQPLPSSMSAIALPPSFVDQPSCPQPASFSDNHDTLSPSSYSPIASSSSSLKVAQEVSCGGCTCSDCLNSACTQQPLPTCLLPLSSASVSSSSSSMLMTNGTPQQSPILSPSLSPSSQVNALIAHQKPQQLPASTTIMSPPFYGAQHTMSDPSAYTSSPLGPMVTPPPLLSGPIQNSPYSSLIPSSYSPSSPPTMAVGSLETGPSMAASSSSSSPSVSTTFILSTPASFSSNASSSSGAATPSFTYASSAPASSMFHHHFPPRPEPHPPLSSSCYSSLSSPPSLASSTDSYAFSAVTTSSLTDIRPPFYFIFRCSPILSATDSHFLLVLLNNSAFFFCFLLFIFIFSETRTTIHNNNSCRRYRRRRCFLLLSYFCFRNNNDKSDNRSNINPLSCYDIDLSSFRDTSSSLRASAARSQPRRRLRPSFREAASASPSSSQHQKEKELRHGCEKAIYFVFFSCFFCFFFFVTFNRSEEGRRRTRRKNDDGRRR